MITATKQVTFALGHMLAEHQGLCCNFHGHEYLLEVTLRRSAGTVCQLGPAKNMVVDFKEIKDMIQTAILDKYDHAMCIWKDSPDPCEQEVRDVLLRFNKKVALVDYRPTAEIMVREMALELQREIDKKYDNIVVCAARLWETRTSYADWCL